MTALAHKSNRILSLGGTEALARRELYFFNLYRVLLSAGLCAVCFGPWAEQLISLDYPNFARIGSIIYLCAAVSLLLFQSRGNRELGAQVLVGLATDFIAAFTAIMSISELSDTIALLYVVNMACAALLLPARSAYASAIITGTSVATAIGFLVPSIISLSTLGKGIGYFIAYIAVTALCQLLRKQYHETEALVVKQEHSLASLSELNDLIIRRMRIGAIVVDSDNQIQTMNEAAWHLIGNPKPDQRKLAVIAPELTRRLYHWRQYNKIDLQAVALAEQAPEVIPRFVKSGLGDGGGAIIFLDDTSLVSSQAEKLTLNSLGRLSASIAHEIRNPLAAISHSAQLLAESEMLDAADRRLIEIVLSQSSRMNSIIDNILQLSRRDRSRPEVVDLSTWVPTFIDEYRHTNPLGQDDLRASVQAANLVVTFDLTQLHQVAWNLVQNAIRYGRQPNAQARVTALVRSDPSTHNIVLEVIDRGPGITAKAVARIFEPFFTTHEHGTGLGLYIARQICEANQASLDYVAVAGGGSCFRVSFAPRMN